MLGLELKFASGSIGGSVLGSVGGLVLGSVRGLVFGGEGGILALANTLKVIMGGLGGGEDEVAGHLIERGVAWVFHPANACLPPVDIAHSAHLQAP